MVSLQYLLGEFPRLTVSGHLIAISLMNPNACGHPSIMYGQWEGWDGNPVEQVPMFYTGVSEETGELYTRMSDECVQLGKVISEKTGADMSQVGTLFFGFRPSDLSRAGNHYMDAPPQSGQINLTSTDQGLSPKSLELFQFFGTSSPFTQFISMTSVVFI